MDVNEIRIVNLKRIICEKHNNSIHHFAKSIDRNSSQFYNLFKGDRSFGQKLARDLELALHLAPYTLDKSPDIETITDKIKVISHYNTRTSTDSNFAEKINDIFAIEKSVIEQNGWQIDKLYGITMNDESMSPTIKPNSKVLVDTSQVNIDNGQIYALAQKNKLLIKRVFRELDSHVYEAKPDNKEYEKTKFSLDDDINVVGRVVCLLNSLL